MLSLSGRLEVELNEGLHIFDNFEIPENALKDIEAMVKVLDNYIEMANVLGWNWDKMANRYFIIIKAIADVIKNNYGEIVSYLKFSYVLETLKRNKLASKMESEYIAIERAKYLAEQAK